ncbi:MAG: hypothetical protein HC896_15990 [Bacteroidales bacterium]|nr:hypothetical protein [Bacteroidales bacterium]
MPGEIIIYIEKPTSRHRYVLNYVFSTFFKTPYSILSSEAAFDKHPGPKINYSPKLKAMVVNIFPHGLLNETGIRPLDIPTGTWHNHFVLFYKNEPGFIHFDVFTAVFFLVSRYEEYLPAKRDKHGRYLPENSMAVRHNFLGTPVVDHWCLALGREIEILFPLACLTNQDLHLCLPLM